MLADPFFEESVGDLELNLLLIHGEKGDRFDPDVEILLTDPFL